MDDRIVDFIRALRAVGVRVSLAESQDAFEAIRSLGVSDKRRFQAALRSCLVKQRQDHPVFEALFPLYFRAGSPPLTPASQTLNDRERALLQALERLLSELAELGMSLEGQLRIQRAVEANLQALSQQAGEYAAGMLRRRLSYSPHPPAPLGLLDRPFQGMSERERDVLRAEVARLAARLRTRLALRQRRGQGPRLDAKATLRGLLATGGVPFEIFTRQRQRKAKITLLCDLSTSMRPVVWFLLLLLHQVQDQVARTRTFAFIDHIEEISEAFRSHRPEAAIRSVLERMPPGHYNTDFGRCLQQFSERHMDAIDAQTTVVVCGDGRNNFNHPRADLLEQLARRVRLLAWFNPEPPHAWGSGDSDMPSYRRAVDAAYQVANLRQLSQAIDQLML